MLTDRLYLYAIVTGAHPLESALTGLADAAVTLLPYRDLAAAVSAVASEGVRPDPEQLLCHERVVEALMGQRSTLPVRFGTVLDADSLLATLAERYTTFAADLVRLAGQVEIGVRVLWDPEAIRRSPPVSQCPEQRGRLSAGLPKPPAPAAGPGDERPGTRYLLDRAREVAVERQLREAAQALETWCLARLKPLASDSTTRLLTTAAMPVSAAFLTPRSDMAALLAAAAQMQRERPDLDLVCTGPWPPYHFVTK
jgi:hypothetical protein